MAEVTPNYTWYSSHDYHRQQQPDSRSKPLISLHDILTPLQDKYTWQRTLSSPDQMPADLLFISLEKSYRSLSVELNKNLTGQQEKQENKIYVH